MSSKRIADFRCGTARQRGAVLLVILVIIIVGAAAFLLHTLNSYSLQTARNKVTADALAKAKDALIAYAVTYGDTHPGYANGYLPSPDPNGLGSGANREGSSEPSPGTNVSAIGRLPWKTLDLPPLRDGNGECLWYAVSGTYKDSTISASMMDWDNYGLFQIYAAPNVPLTGTTPDTYAVAAVFSPGVSLSGQNRTSDGSAPICGGNYTAGNYLDHDTFSSTFYNNAAPSTTANAISTFFNIGASANFNDQIIYITRSDIFNAIKKRNDFAGPTGFINTMISMVANCLSTNHPNTVSLNYNNLPPTESPGQYGGNYQAGRVPRSCLTSPWNNWPGPSFQNWQDNLLYAYCLSGKCLTVNGSQCHGMVIFTGEKTPTQSRTQKTDRSSYPNALPSYVANYIETTTNYNKFTSDGTYSNGTIFNGVASSYNSTATSTDIFACVP